MTELPNGFDLHGVHVYQSTDDPQTFYYIPGEPQPERSPSGKPTLNLFVTDKNALLQLGTRWEVNADLLTELQKQVQDLHPEINQSSILLTPAPVSINKASLILMTDDDKEEELQAITSSGFPPYAAVFNVGLTNDQKTRVASALSGCKGRLKAVYNITLQKKISVESTITGDVRADIAKLETSASANDCQILIEIALTEGRLHFERVGSEDAPIELKEKADRMAKEKAADILLSMARLKESEVPLDTANLEAKAMATTTGPVQFTRSTDVASWYASAEDAAASISIAPSALNTTAAQLAPSSTANAIVRVGFDLKDAPVAFIQIAWDQSRATIRPPVFNPVTINGRTDKPILVKTSYTDGGPPYETNLPAPVGSELKLTSQDIGLALITVDANARHQTGGATQAQLQVNYKPSGRGTADEHIIRLRYGDWTDSWYVVTRSSGLDGTFEIKWTETTADGSVVEHETVTTNKTEIKL